MLLIELGIICKNPRGAMLQQQSRYLLHNFLPVSAKRRPSLRVLQHMAVHTAYLCRLRNNIIEFLQGMECGGICNDNTQRHYFIYVVRLRVDYRYELIVWIDFYARPGFLVFRCFRALLLHRQHDFRMVIARQLPFCNRPCYCIPKSSLVRYGNTECRVPADIP